MSKHLTQQQRYYICIQNARGILQSRIAKALGVHKSTISREIKRNQRAIADYDSDYAQKNASLKRSHASSSKAFRKMNKNMKAYIDNKLKMQWSPEQISGRMKKEIGKSISHETIYQYVKYDRQNGGKLHRTPLVGQMA